LLKKNNNGDEARVKGVDASVNFDTETLNQSNGRSVGTGDVKDPI